MRVSACARVRVCACARVRECASARVRVRVCVSERACVCTHGSHVAASCARTVNFLANRVRRRGSERERGENERGSGGHDVVDGGRRGVKSEWVVGVVRGDGVGEEC